MAWPNSAIPSAIARDVFPITAGVALPNKAFGLYNGTDTAGTVTGLTDKNVSRTVAIAPYSILPVTFRSVTATTITSLHGFDVYN